MRLTEKQVLERLERRKEISSIRIAEFQRWLRHEKLFMELMKREHEIPITTTIALSDYGATLSQLEEAVDKLWSEYMQETVEIAPVQSAQHV